MASKDSNDRVSILEAEKANLTDELIRLKQSPSGSISYIFLNIGIIFMLLSLVHTDSILASIGVALTFFGGFFLYIKPYRFIRKDILDACYIENIENINAILKAENFSEKPRYTSSGTLEGIEKVNLFFFKNNADKFNNIEKVNSGDKNSIKIIPAGIKLSKLIETELNKSFLLVDLEYIKNNLESVLVKNLELIKSFSMNIEEDKIFIKLENTLFNYFFNNTNNILNGIYEVDPLTSSLACILSFTSQKTIFIDKIDWDQNNRTESITYIMV